MSECVSRSSDASRAARGWRPTFAPLVRSARMCRALAGLAVFQIACGLLHVNGIDCPFLQVFRIPCPGCGASRACAELLSGHASHAFHMHALAPLLLLAALLSIVAA